MSPEIETEMESQENTNNTALEMPPADQPSSLPVSTDIPGTLLKLPTPDKVMTNQEWRELGEKVVQFLVQFPDYLNQSFGEYRKPLTTVGLITLAGISVAIADGVLSRLNSIPLFAPTFELIGLGFTGWVIFRYLLYADTRQELFQEYYKLQERILGREEDM